jgi:two-component system phosphate regulon sensor histidine kinase PhoR
MTTGAFQAPRRFQVAFVGGMLVLASALGWLAWTLVVQQRELAARRRTEQTAATADLAVAHLLTRIQGLHDSLTHWRDAVRTAPAELPAGAAVVRYAADGVRVFPNDGLAYWPDPVLNGASHAAALALVDRAAADVRAGRVARALAVYDELAALGRAPVANMPAALAARVGRLWVFERTGDAAAAAAERQALGRDLDAARWPIEYGAYRYLAGEADPSGATRTVATRRAALARAEAAAWIRDRWHDAGRRLADGREAVETAAGSALVVWREFDGELVALVADGTFVDREVEQPIRPVLQDRRAHLVLTSPGAPAPPADAGATSASRPVIRVAAETGLPWTVHVVPAPDPDGGPAARWPFAAGLGLLVGMVLASGWVIGRALTRELAARRLQSDFVAGISHEFRTPLSTLYQLSEMLKLGRVANDAERQVYYDLLHAESDRLRRLVEGLLSFGRLESRQADFQRAPLDLARRLPVWVEEFRTARPTPGHRVDHEQGPAEAVVEADEEALRCAVWNLLENAVKYSPSGGTVCVGLEADARRVAVTIRDNGVGIPRREQARIFDRFVRGEAARAHHIGGTGLGLPLTRLIARAHGGDVAVASEPGRGSTFTIALPLATSRGSGRREEPERRSDGGGPPVMTPRGPERSEGAERRSDGGGAPMTPRGPKRSEGAERRERLGVGPQPH